MHMTRVRLIIHFFYAVGAFIEFENVFDTKNKYILISRGGNRRINY